jgi:hypothetical protein
MTHTLTSGYQPNLTEAQLNENYEYFIEFLKEKFTGDRLEKLLKLYSEDHLGIQLCTAPASPRSDFHCGFPGGYLIHVMNVEKASRGADKLFAAMGGTIDYTEEERLFAALHHDLGKLGDLDFGPYYVPQTDEWRQKKLGEVYTINKEAPPWDVTDRALYILQKYGITMTWKENIAIMLSDGVFKDKNKSYYNSMTSLRTSLINVIHWADWISCRAEKSQFEAATK